MIGPQTPTTNMIRADSTDDIRERADHAAAPLTYDERLAARYRAGLDPRRLALAERLAAAVDERRRCLAGRDKIFLRHRIGARGLRELETACEDAFELGLVRFGFCLAAHSHLFIAPPLRGAQR